MVTSRDEETHANTVTAFPGYLLHSLSYAACYFQAGDWKSKPGELDNKR